jgi:hypothetical protein
MVFKLRRMAIYETLISTPLQQLPAFSGGKVERGPWTRFESSERFPKPCFGGNQPSFAQLRPQP